MSVNAGQRGTGKLAALEKANELAVYTIQICVNPKVFKPEYQNALTDDIIRTAKDIFVLAWSANSIRVGKDADRWRERKRLQALAIDRCNTLLALTEIAHRLYHLKHSRVEYWAEMTINVRTMLRAWRESDGRRYNHLL